MSDKPLQGGPHPTMAGNMLDPGVEADGAMTSSHQGVGGTSEGNVRREGMEHIKSEGGVISPDQSTSGTGVPDRSYGEGGAAALGAGTVPATASSGATTGPSGSDDTTMPSGNDPMRDTERSASRPMDSDVTTGTQPSESADPTSQEESKKGGEGEEEKSSSKPKERSDHEHDSKRENKDAIPKAGGEKLGQKHWGESKMVADVPKPKEEEEKVSSSEGQPNKQTENNTSSNTGDAKPPQQHLAQGEKAGEAESKPGMAEKMKGMLGMGK